MGQDRTVFLPQDKVNRISFERIKTPALLNDFAHLTEDFGLIGAPIIPWLARWPGLIRGLVQQRIGGPWGSLRTAQGHQPLVQLLVNAPQLIVARDVVCGQRKCHQHHDQDDPVPDLKPPADGIEDHDAG
jgi:hypothetical protein